jgi:hypothetical protein
MFLTFYSLSAEILSGKEEKNASYPLRMASINRPPKDDKFFKAKPSNLSQQTSQVITFTLPTSILRRHGYGEKVGC